MSSTVSPKKPRIRKACDNCNSKRTKCDGKQPCAHCFQVKIDCTYLREEKRRGRASEKYPKQIKKRKSKANKEIESVKDNVLGNLSGSNGHILINSKKPETVSIAHAMISDYSNLASGIIPSNPLLNRAPQNFELGVTRYPILNNASEDLRKIGMQYEVADELFEYYFDLQFPPTPRVFSILRRQSMLQSSRPTQSNLLLCILLAAAVQIDHRFFAGSNRDYACQSLYRLIQEKLPSQKLLFTFDDFLCLVHLGFLMPWLSYPSDSVYWWKLGYDVAIHLKLNEQNALKGDEKEERIRGWWGLFILDRLTALCFNLFPVLTDSECSDVYYPCDETLWTHTSQIIQEPHKDPQRVKGVDYKYITDGIYGWSITSCALMGKYIQMRKCVNLSTKNLLKTELLKLQEDNLHSIENFQKRIKHIQSLERKRGASIDALYAKYINLSLTLITKDDLDPETLGTLGHGITEEQISDLSDLIVTLEQIMKMDEDCGKYAFFLSFFLFTVSVAVLSVLDDINCTDVSTVRRINKLKYIFKVLVRVIEGHLVVFPAEFLRTVRNQLTLSTKDCENLILLTDYIDRFKENTRKRKEVLKAYSWALNGRGIAV